MYGDYGRGSYSGVSTPYTPGSGHGYGHGDGASAAPTENRFAELYAKLDDMQAGIASTKSLLEASGSGAGLSRVDPGAGDRGAPSSRRPEYTGGSVAPPPQLTYEEPRIDISVLPISEGFLYKKSGGFGGMRTWRRRYFRIHMTSLYYFKTERDSQPSGQFTVSPYTTIDASGRLHKNKKVKNDFTVRDEQSQRQLELYAESQEDYERWIQTIQFMKDQCTQAQQVAIARYEAATSGAGSGFASGAMSVASPVSVGAPQLSEAEKEALADDAVRHTAYGPGLVEAVRGEVAKFCIQSNDEAGNPLAGGGLPFEAFIVNVKDIEPDGTTKHSIPLTVNDLGDGTYAVEYTRLDMSEIELSIKLSGYHIYGSPFNPTVLPAPTSAGCSVVEGDGVLSAFIGEQNTFTIVAKDQWKERRVTGGDKWIVEMSGPVKMDTFVDNQDGTYTVTYSVVIDGVSSIGLSPQKLPTMNCEISVGLDDGRTPFARPCRGSPFHPDLKMPRRNPDAGYLALTSGYATPMGSATPAPYGARGAAAGAVPFTGEFFSPESKAAEAEHVEAIARRERVLREGFQKLEAEQAALEDARRLVDAMRSEYERKLSELQSEYARLDVEKSELALRERRLKEREDIAVTPGYVEALPMQHPSPSRSDALPGLGGPPSDTLLRQAPPPRPQPPAGAPGTGPKPPAGPPPVAVPPSSRPVGASMFPDAESRPTMSGLGAEPPKPPAAAAPTSQQLFEPDVMMLFDQFRGPVYSVFAAYSEGGAMSVTNFITMTSEFDMCPTFVSKKELRQVFADAVAAQVPPSRGDTLGYPGFVEALARVALVSLSKPAFEHLYPSAKEKVSVLLEMWGVGDPKRLEEVLASRG